MRHGRFAQHGRGWPEMAVAGPDWHDIARAAMRARGIAPGPDGLRSAAWGRAGQVAWKRLGRLMWATMGGESLPEEFVATLLVFLPTGALRIESGCVARDWFTTATTTCMSTTVFLLLTTAALSVKWEKRYSFACRDQSCVIVFLIDIMFGFISLLLGARAY